jgi:glycosyltransferase involved in cell wall biosynthesis
MSHPKISVITPSYNQGAFIEKTILSVLDQNYPNLEYIVIDGGSTDGSVEIIQKYADRLTYWISEKDRGQSHAINKGFLRATGDILCWLNSDDYFLPGTLEFVAEQLGEEAGTPAIAGHCRVVYTDGTPPMVLTGGYTSHEELIKFWTSYEMHQPAIFWRREVYEKVGLLDEDLHYIMDFDYWTRMSQYFGFKPVDRILACATYHAAAKTGDGYAQYRADLRKYAKNYWGSPWTLGYWRLAYSMWLHFSWIRTSVRGLKAKLPGS